MTPNSSDQDLEILFTSNGAVNHSQRIGNRWYFENDPKYKEVGLFKGDKIVIIPIKETLIAINSRKQGGMGRIVEAEKIVFEIVGLRDEELSNGGILLTLESRKVIYTKDYPEGIITTVLNNQQVHTYFRPDNWDKQLIEQYGENIHIIRANKWNTIKDTLSKVSSGIKKIFGE